VRIGVIGAGAVGGSLAAVLDRQGHELVVTARGEHLASIREQGLRLDGEWGAHTARISAVETLPTGLELVLLAVKATGAAAALEANAAALDGAPLLVVQNGLDAIEVASERAPQVSDLLGGLGTWAVSHLEPGLVTVTGSGRLYLGAGHGAPTPVVRRIGRVLSEVVETSVVDDFAGAQWTKLIINQVNALPAITGLSVQQVVDDHRLRRILTASMREAVRIGLAAGVVFAAMQGMSDAILRRFARGPLWMGQSIPLAIRKRMGPVPNPGSTLQSIRRGQRTEIDALNGAVVRAAERIGQAAPVNAMLTRLVHEVEAGHAFFTAEEVVAVVEG